MTSLLWLAGGAAVIVFEFFITPGIGVAFAGLGALTTGALLEFGLLDGLLEQLVAFVLATIFWTVLLWKPLKKLLDGKGKGSNESHLIGAQVQVCEGGVSKLQGVVKWSGTQMQARLADNAGIEMLAEGAFAEIVSVDGATLFIKPKQ